MIGLGIETSCDETSIGIVEDGKKQIVLTLFSQIELHSAFKGVVPEIASRAHLEKINFLLETALEESGLKFTDLDYVAVTAYPGLLGSLMVGAQMARCLSYALEIPLIAVDHLEAHLNVVRMEEKDISFPYIGVLLSGGNSAIFQVDGFGNMRTIGDTKDDALGEAFDKVATLLNLGYPGGPAIEESARRFQGKTAPPLFPELLKDLPSDKIQFSYSGLKTAVLYYLKKNSTNTVNIDEVAYHFQETAFQLVEKNIKRAVKLTGIRNVIAAGGVMANDTLRQRLNKVSHKMNFKFKYPEKKILCTDNGVMVACLGYYLLKEGKLAGIDFRVSPSRQEM